MGRGDQPAPGGSGGGKIKGGFALLDVYRTSDGKLIYSQAFGGSKTRNDPLAVASASKWVTSTVILSLVAEGKLTLEDTTSKWLGWIGARGQITLRQLLTFTSGLRDNLCLYNPLTTFNKCVTAIHKNGLKNVPGKVFYYAGAHMHVAGLMAQKAAGKAWAQIFADKLLTRLRAGRRHRLLRLTQDEDRQAEPSPLWRPGDQRRGLRQVPHRAGWTGRQAAARQVGQGAAEGTMGGYHHGGELSRGGRKIPLCPGLLAAVQDTQRCNRLRC